MRIVSLIVLAGSLVALTVLASGCFNKDRDDSQIPWARPASWEGAPPGMGPGGGFGY